MKLTPALQKYRVEVVAQMLYYAEETEEGKTWEGLVTKLVEDSGIPQGYYRQVVRSLEDDGFITELQKGTHSRPSRFRINVEHENEVAQYDEAESAPPQPTQPTKTTVTVETPAAPAPRQPAVVWGSMDARQQVELLRDAIAYLTKHVDDLLVRVSNLENPTTAQQPPNNRPTTTTTTIEESR